MGRVGWGRPAGCGRFIGVVLEGLVLARRPTGPLPARGVTDIRVGGLAAPGLGIGFGVDIILKVGRDRSLKC